MDLKPALLCASLLTLIAPPRVRAIDAPKLFPPEAEWPTGSDASPAFTPDGRTVFFTHAVGTARTIMMSHLRDGTWSRPEVAPFSGTWRDVEPAMAPDGTYLVFISNRPAEAGGKALDGFFGGAARPGAGGNIWRVDRQGGAGREWSTPVRLPSIVNSHSAIYSPALAQDGSVYFNQPDPITKKSHIYRAQSTRDGFLAPVPLGISHGEVADFDAAVAPDESFVVFSSVRPPAPPGQPVLFISFRKAGDWTAPAVLEPVTAGLEARLSPDLATLYFSTEVPPSHPEGTGQSAGGGDPVSRIFVRPLEARADPSDTATANQFEERWLAALAQRDHATLDTILADGFVQTTWDGKLRCKSDVLAKVGEPAPPGTTQHLVDVTAQRYGDTLVVRGINVVRSPNGEHDARLRFTDVLVLQAGVWRAVAAQETLVRE